MKKLFTNESVRLLFDLGIELLKTFKDIYNETKTERILTDEDATKNNDRDNQKDSNSSNTANNH
ncbi:MAG: hypothetical protein NTY74_13425 [Ignavibacteriae bacterium]|nr:hypothetical protein [Ignavibacteriota bacterium]